MTLEEARDIIARDLLRLGAENGIPNRFYCSDLTVGALIAGRIGNRYINSLQIEITRLRPNDTLRVSYDSFKPGQRKTFHLYRAEGGNP